MTKRRGKQPVAAKDGGQTAGGGGRAGRKAGGIIRRLLTLLVWATALAAILLVWFAWDLPNPKQLAKAGVRQPAITVLDMRDGVIARTGAVHGPPVQLTELPPYLPRAFLAVEDKRFYRHFGLDPVSLLRAVRANLRAGGIREGGSTITQQLAKNLFLQPDRTLRRKVQEALLALWLERSFSKDEILTIYLNRVYLGGGAYRVEAAARLYFNKPARLLTVAESAMLAGLPKAPSRDNPHAAPERAAQRMRLALNRMADAGWLDRAAAAALLNAPPPATTPPQANNARYVADWAIMRAQALIGPVDGDLVIRTVLNPAHQRAAEQALAATATEAAAGAAGQTALVAITGDGAVTAMLGGRNWTTGPFNRATAARRQPGSAFKPVVFLAALESGLTPDSLIDPAGVDVEGWSPREAGRKPDRPVTLREAAARSLNGAAVLLSERVGRDKVVAAARRLGLTAPLSTDPALALGVHEVGLLELTAAYAVFANGGITVTPYMVREIRDGAGKLLYRRRPAAAARAMAPETAAAMTDLLGAAVAWGTGKAAQLPGRKAAGKTGTTQNNRDAWFIGYADGLTAGVWTGNDDNSPMQGVGGGGLPARSWRAFMTAALAAR